MLEHINHNRCLRRPTMTANKPGTVNQQPLFECANCYEHVTYHADHLRVYNGQCWCETCWEEMTHEITDGRDWGELELFKPAQEMIEALEWIVGVDCKPGEGDTDFAVAMVRGIAIGNIRRKAEAALAAHCKGGEE